MVTLFCFQSCSAIFWRNGSQVYDPSYSETGESSAVLNIQYEEKNTWNPLDGTTIKRNYHSQILLFKNEKERSQNKPLKVISLNSWILPDSVYFHEKNSYLFFIRGTDDNFGTNPRKSYLYRISDEKEFLNHGEGDATLAIPSPDGGKIAIILSYPKDPETFSYKLLVREAVDQEKTDPVRISFWPDNPGYVMTWDTDSGNLFIRQDRIVLVKGSDKNQAIVPTKTFPKCFLPGTSFGVGFLREGKVSSWGKNKISSVENISDCRI